jgi:hypothetical protein
MSKTLTITISDDYWQAFKEAVEGHELAGNVSEQDYEAVAQRHLFQAIDRRIKQHKHPETGLTKQQMVHYRRGELAAKQWLFSEKGATQEQFEQAGRTWSSRTSKQEHIQESVLQGWLSRWKE